MFWYYFIIWHVPEKKKNKWADNPPTKEFFNAFRVSSSDEIECEFCGRVYLSAGSAGQYKSDRDYDYYWELMDKEPEKYFLVHDDRDTIPYCLIDGHQYPFACKCNAMTSYEDFVWRHRWEIVNYFAAVVREMEQTATVNSKLVKELKRDLGFLHDKKAFTAKAIHKIKKAAGIK